MVDKKTIEAGLKIADSKIFEEDKIWSRYSNDKVNIGETLSSILRTLFKALPLFLPIRALSVGSSNEPQFRILASAFQGGLYLVDIEKEALGIVRERIHRQFSTHVKPIHYDYTKIFLSRRNTDLFLKKKLEGRRMNLVTLHHSLYYCEEKKWQDIFENIYGGILAPTAAIHAVLMSAESNQPYSTTWLYNHFVGKFFGYQNEQDLHKFKKEMEGRRILKRAKILFKKSCVRFFVPDFEKFMAVIWMILLYPNVHQYSQKQKEEITEFIYKRFWQKKKPLLQIQDHMAVYKGINFKGLV